MISNAAMLPLLIGARDMEDLDDVTEPQKDAPTDQAAADSDPEVEILDPEDQAGEEQVEEAHVGDTDNPESQKKPESVS